MITLYNIVVEGIPSLGFLHARPSEVGALGGLFYFKLVEIDPFKSGQKKLSVL